MIELNNRTIDDYGIVYATVEQLYDVLIQGGDISGFKAVQSDALDVYNASVKKTDEAHKTLQPYTKPTISVTEYDKERQNIWNIPEKYRNMDIYSYIITRVNTDEERNRVDFEYAKYEEYGLEMVLKALLFLTDTFKEHNVIKGVGRGSCVSSYILYIIGVHKVNSITYDLDFSEFLE